jgi:hypothetical protein
LKTNRSFCLPLLASFAVASVVQAQQDDPHIGYVYPAGGQQGTKFQVLLGGQHLDGATIAHVSGGGVEAVVIEHIRPLNQGQFKEMQNRMGELQQQKDAAAPGGSGRRGRGGSQPFSNEHWTAEDEAELAEIRRRLATFSIRRSSVAALVETVTLSVTIAADAMPGKRELRLRTEQGLTNPRIFCVGQLAEITEPSRRSLAVAESQARGGRGRKNQQSARPDPGTSPTTTAPEQETEIAVPTIINGQILPGDVDRYRFQARKGQQLVVDVRARRLIPYLSDAVPGWFQAAVALSDADGHEIAYEDDFHLHPDPVLHCEIPADGQYVIEIRDALYRGREDFVYRIAIGELPFITSIFPLGGPSGTATAIELCGWNLPTRTLSQMFPEPGVYSVSVLDGNLGSNRVPFAADTLPECLETEPNHESKTAGRMTIPVTVNGRIDRPGDVDVFCFECRAGDQVVAEVNARRLGSPLDSAIKLTTAAGVQLAFNDDYEDRASGLATHHADSRLSVRIPDDGWYLLHLGDAQQMGGVDYGYRLRVDRQQPDFELRVVPSSINARAGSTVPITVHALRTDGFSGEITLGLKDPPPGYTLSGGRLPAGQDVIRLTLTVPEESPGEPQTLVLEGFAMIGRNEVVRPVIPADDMMQAFIYRHLVPAEELQVAVIGTPRRSTMNVLGDGPVKINAGGVAEVLVDVPSRSIFGAIQLELSHPPEGITIEDVTLGRWQGRIVLRSDATTQPGLAGNLIVNVFAAKTGEDSGRGKEQRKKTADPTERPAGDSVRDRCRVGIGLEIAVVLSPLPCREVISGGGYQGEG